MVKATEFWHRRRETREERRQRCHRPRKRTGGHGREPGTQLFFLGSADLPSPGRNPLGGVPESRPADAEHTPATSRPGGSLPAAPRPGCGSRRDGERSPLAIALAGALASTGTTPVRVQVTQGGEGSAAHDDRLSHSLHLVWTEEIGPAEPLPADLAERIDALAERFNDLRGCWNDRWAADRVWLPRSGAADAKAAAPILRLHLDGGTARDRREPCDPSGAGSASSGSASERSTAAQATRRAAGQSPADDAAAAVRSSAALQLYATAVAAELQQATEKHEAWRRRRATHETRKARR